MDKHTLFESFKQLLVKSHLNDDPSLTEAELTQIKSEIDQKVTLESPISSLWLDSMKMTWLIVRFEDALDVNAAGLSFFELFDVNDLMDELIDLVKEQKGKTLDA